MTDNLKPRLQSMDEYDFEHLVADVWSRMGWETEVSQASVDAGIDVIATKETPYPQKKVIQAKRYGENTTVGGPDIQQYASLKHQVEGADSVVIVTTNSFTSSAESRAKDLNVKLVDGDDLVELIRELNAEDLVDQYLPQARQSVTQETAIDGGTANAFSERATDPARSPANSEGDSVGTLGDQPLQNVEEDREWHIYTAYGIGAWFVLLFAAGVISGVAILEPLFSLLSLVWFGVTCAIPVMLYLDMRFVRRQTDWHPSALWYIGAGLFFPYVALPLYYYRRRKHIGL